jgi:hypothetical protein
MKYALEEWLKEASGDVAAPQSPMGMPDSPAQPSPDVANANAPSMDPNAAQASNQAQVPNEDPNAADQQQQMPDVTQDPAAPDMPEEMQDQDFEEWKNSFFKESIKGDVSKLLDLIHQVRDMNLDSYPRKFVEDNLQICFLRQYANIDKACKEIRKLIKDDLDRNNPAVSIVNHIDSTLQSMPELNNIFIKLKGLLGMKGDLHRKLLASITGSIQVGTGGNNEDIIYNEKEYSVRISTRYNDRWGKVDIGKWSLKQDDVEKYLTEPEQKRLEEGSPEEKDVLRRRIVMESVAETFKKRGFIINVVGEDGTIYMLGWDISTSLKNAYTDGKLVVRTSQGESSDAMINDEGEIVPYMDIKIKYSKETGELDEDGKPIKEEHEFMERTDGMLFLTAQFNILKEAASGFSGMVLKETPYNGNPSDLMIIQRCVPSSQEILTRTC